ncbi:MAG: Fic family protein [Dysgonamonadaceae bacterium]|nr:Fic family protein [Dysgonamonadaceae bacterium]
MAVNDRKKGLKRNLKAEYKQLKSDKNDLLLMIAEAELPELVGTMLDTLIYDYLGDDVSYFVEKIARFHLEFEYIHPFCDGNGRMSRVLINQKLANYGYPPVIIQNSGKHKEYFPYFAEYQNNRKLNDFDSHLALALIESLYKRIVYLKGNEISQYAKGQSRSLTTLLDSAKRQTIPAFRLQQTWNIGKEII